MSIENSANAKKSAANEFKRLFTTKHKEYKRRKLVAGMPAGASA